MPKVVIVALATLLIIGLTASATLTAYRLFDDHETSLGVYRSPRVVSGTRPGVEGPAVTEVGMITVRGYRCVYGANPVTVELYVTYVSLDADPPRRIPDPFYSANTQPRNRTPRIPGCFDETSIFNLPPEVTAGRWYIEAAESPPNGGELRRWFSEAFTVVSRGN